MGGMPKPLGPLRPTHHDPGPAPAAAEPDTIIIAMTYYPLPQNLVGGTDCLHPNDSGHQIIADLFAAALAGAAAQAA
jgi:lysophospholipase L1-like esterase